MTADLCVQRLGLLELLQLFVAGFFLELVLPLTVRHSVYGLPRIRVADVHPAFLRGGQVPFRQAVAAETRQIHQVDILHIRAFLEVLYQAAERSGFDLGTCFLI